MPKKTYKILMVFDLPQAHDHRQGYERYLQDKAWRDEKHVYQSLKKLGHNVSVVGIYDDIKKLLEKIETFQPDIVFPLCECFDNNRAMATNIVSMLELMNVKFTGAPSQALAICQDKAISKAILSHYGINTPNFAVSHCYEPLKRIENLSFPVIVKPLELEASEGIAKSSFASSEKDALQRLEYLHKKLTSDAIIEEFIPGRELYVGVIGNKKTEVFPPREFVITSEGNNPMIFATYKAKWDESYRRKHGIKNQTARNLDDETRNNIAKTCAKIYRLFHLRGYARIDLRLADTGKLYFLEANPNPAIAKDDDFASGAKLAGFDYDELINNIVKLAAS